VRHGPGQGMGIQGGSVMEKGRLYGLGVGPGDPELMTVKAVRLLKKCQLIAIPQKEASRCLALQIALRAVPEAAEKPILALPMPMIRDTAARERAYALAAEALVRALQAGQDVAFLTLGDPTIYSTYGYLHAQVLSAGYEAQIVPGVPSFCAGAAALGVPLCLDGEELHLIPGGPSASDALAYPGTKVFMKGGVPDLKEAILQSDGPVFAAEKVGMEGQRLFRAPKQIPEDPGYFTLIIAKEKEL